MIKLNDKYVLPFLKERKDYSNKIRQLHESLHQKIGKGNDFLGWLNLPNEIKESDIEDIIETANIIRKQSKILLVIGIGGSYLGLKAALGMLGNHFDHEIEVLFAGHQLSENYLSDLYNYLKDKDFSINVISKSGTTTEPAIAFRIFKNLLEEKYGNKAKERIFVTTDKEKGALKELALMEGYKTFVLADDIGGRFSVITPVGLLGMAVAGIDIKQVIAGFKDSYKDLLNLDNDAYKYALLRYQLYQSGKAVEMLVSYDPEFKYFLEWWKQLFGESEGKDLKGLFVASAEFTTDLHSLGQLIQDGPRIMFETVLKVKGANKEMKIPFDEKDLDGLNYLQDKRVFEVNEKAFLGTLLAHNEGGVPNIIIEIDKLDAYHFGYLVYFFFKACAMSAYLIDVNPFDQPGVEAYKRNMFALLGKKGFEELQEELNKKG